MTHYYPLAKKLTPAEQEQAIADQTPLGKLLQKHPSPAQKGDDYWLFCDAYGLFGDSIIVDADEDTTDDDLTLRVVGQMNAAKGKVQLLTPAIAHRVIKNPVWKLRAGRYEDTAEGKAEYEADRVDAERITKKGIPKYSKTDKFNPGKEAMKTIEPPKRAPLLVPDEA